MVAWQCPVCLSSLRNSFDGNNYPLVIVQCEHSICNACYLNLKNKQCPTCRKENIQVVKNIALAQEYNLDVTYSKNEEETIVPVNEKETILPVNEESSIETGCWKKFLIDIDPRILIIVPIIFIMCVFIGASIIG